MKHNAISGWYEIDGREYFFRSKLELLYANYLEWLRINGNITDWEYEPETFWFEGIKRGVVSYKPDFKITRNDLSWHWVEVKGYMDSKSKTKIARFSKYFPKEKLEVVTSAWFTRNQNKLRGLVPGWD